MDKQQEHLEDLAEIRAMMERSSRFISLSGLSGVFAGIFAIIGFAVAYFKAPEYGGRNLHDYFTSDIGTQNFGFYYFCIIDALVVLAASIFIGILLTVNKVKKQGGSVWSSTSKRLLINLFLPLIAGGIFCISLMWHGLIAFVPSATLIFYGLALINASKYTLEDVRRLGICELILGIIASICIGYGFIFWVLGFGILHIIYGIIMYNKYER
jgi:hypothetical protein